jgi:hypothetical protein
MVYSNAIAAAQGIPDAFIGEWSANVAKCSLGADGSFLKIESHHIQIGEITGEVKAVVSRGRELAVILELTQRGKTWLSAQQFIVSAHGSRLLSTTGKVRFERSRCDSQSTRPNYSLEADGFAAAQLKR